jgi:hypothetical protein
MPSRPSRSTGGGAAVPPVAPAPLSPSALAELLRRDHRARAAEAADAAPDAQARRPAPRATAALAETRREAARRIAALAELAQSGGVSGVSLLGGGGGAGGPAPEGPQARVAWAIARLRRITDAVGADVVALDAQGGRVPAVELVARVCIRDEPPAVILRALGVKRSRGRALAILRGLDAALGRAAVAEGLETPAIVTGGPRYPASQPSTPKV